MQQLNVSQSTTLLESTFPSTYYHRYEQLSTSTVQFIHNYFIPAIQIDIISADLTNISSVTTTSNA